MPDLNRLELTEIDTREREFVNGTASEAILPRGMQSASTAGAAAAMEFDKHVCIGISTPHVARVHEDSVREFRWRASAIVHTPGIR